MARLFISYNHKDFAYAYAVRHWLITEQGWTGNDIFVDASHLHTGVEWERKLFAEAEAAEVMLFLASDDSLDRRSFCYKELQRAKGQILAVTIRGISFSDERLADVLPEFAKTRQVTALDQEPTEAFPFVSPVDQTTGAIPLNRTRMEGIGLTLRELGVAPNSFTWKPTLAGPFPGLRPLQEGDEAVFCGRDLEIRDGIKAIEDLRGTVTKRVLILQAPSGAGKSSFLRAGLWRRLRRNPGFTPLCIVRTPNGLFHNPDWGLIAGLSDVFQKNPALAKNLPLSTDALARRATTDLAGLLAAFADADAYEGVRRTLLIGIDQAEEIAALSPGDDEELTKFLRVITSLPPELDVRLILTARDDSVDATLDRLVRRNLTDHQIQTWRLNRLPAIRFDEIITGPAEAANRAGWPLEIESGLVEALGAAAGAGATGESGDALPILALALQRMVAKRRSPDGKIDLSPAEAATFLESAVTDATHDGLKAARSNADDLRQLVIPRLATWDPKAGAEGAAKRQVTSAEDLFAGERVRLKPLADALVDQHLLVRSQTESGPAYEVAHEALLRVPPLGKLIYDCREKFEQARILEVEARDWSTTKSAENLVRSGQRLQDALALLQDPDFGTDLQRRGGVAEYLEACRTHEIRLKRNAERTRGLVVSVLSVLSIIATAGAVYGLRQATTAISQRDAAYLQEGKAWLLRASVAEERQKRYPDTLLYAAQAIGFEGVGRRDDAEEPRRFIRPKDKEYKEAQDWIADHPAYLPVWSSPVGEPVVTMAVDPAGKQLALGSAKGVRLIDVAAGTETTVPGLTGITDLDFLNVGRTFLSGLHHGTMEGTDKNVRPTEGSQLAIAAAEGVHVHSGSTTSVVQKTPLTFLSWSPAGDLLAASAPDGTIHLYRKLDLWSDRQKSQTVGSQIQPTAKVTHLTFSEENSFLAAIAPGAGPRLFFPDHAASASSWEGLEDPRAKLASAVSVAPDGRTLVTGGTDGNVVLWDVETITALAQVSPEQRHTQTVTAVAFRPDGRQIASASGDGTVKLWEIREDALRIVATLTGHTGAVTAVTYAPGGDLLASAGADGTAKLWDVRGEKLPDPDLFTYLDQKWYAFTPDSLWAGGHGFANLRAPELTVRWVGTAQADYSAIWTSIQTTKRWRRADLLQRRGVALPPEIAKFLAEALPKAKPALKDTFTNGNNMTLIWCPPGEFNMGESDQPGPFFRHKVILTKGFWLGKHELTQAQYAAVMGVNPSTNIASGLNAPAENLDWNQALEFCRKLTDQERLRGTIPPGWEYALPTEAQWEYACRAGTETVYSFGDKAEDLHKYGNFNDAKGSFGSDYDGKQDDGHKYTAPVGSFPANPWGFHDMHGNVNEWCRDSIELSDAAYPEGPVTNPFINRGSDRVDRGGSFDYAAADCRSAIRYASLPSSRNSSLGLRPALVPSGQQIVPEPARDVGQGR